MAHDITVVDTSSKLQTEVNWNIKTPGAGLDTLLETLMQTFNIFGSKLVECEEIQSFYNKGPSKDHTANKMTAGAMSHAMGSAIKTDDQGRFVWDSISYTTEAGLAIHLMGGPKPVRIDSLI